MNDGVNSCHCVRNVIDPGGISLSVKIWWRQGYLEQL